MALFYGVKIAVVLKIMGVATYKDNKVGGYSFICKKKNVATM